MIWLGVFGGVSPLSDNGYPSTPVATPTIGGVAFNLIAGHNGNVVVYSFVAQSSATSFSGDLLNFYKCLETNFKLSSGQYLQTVQAGTEVFTGSNAKLTTTEYTIKVNCKGKEEREGLHRGLDYRRVESSAAASFVLMPP